MSSNETSKSPPPAPLVAPPLSPVVALPPSVAVKASAAGLFDDAEHLFPALFEWTQPCDSVGVTGSFNKCVLVSCGCG